MSRVPNDDLFEGTTMTFGEHLEELRGSLFRSLTGLIIGVLLAMIIAAKIVQLIQEPLKNALENYYLRKATDEILAQYDKDAPPEILALVKEEGLVPTKLFMEAAGLVASLKAADPDQFGSLSYKPYRFVPSDIPHGDYEELCRLMVADGDSITDSPGKRLWLTLSEEQQQSVMRVAEGAESSEDARRTALRILNFLVEEPQLAVAEEFQDVDGARRDDSKSFSPSSWFADFVGSQDEHEKAVQRTVTELRDAAQLAFDENHSPPEDDIRRLNKFLISAVYPTVIREPRRLVLDIPSWKPTDIRVQTLAAQEPFMIWLKAATVTGLVITSPWIFWQIWIFVAAGLYPHEKRYIHVYLPFSLILFLCGTAVAFFFVFEPVLNFLFSFNKLMDIDPDPRISEWLSFVLFLPLGFGVAFQLPLVMLFLNRIGMFTLQAYLERWRIAILVIFVISMVLTPADPVSMLLMAVPLTALYFLGIVLCKWMPRGRNPFDDAYEP